MGILKKYEGTDALMTTTVQIKTCQAQYLTQIIDREFKKGKNYSIAFLHRKALDLLIKTYIDKDGNF